MEFLERLVAGADEEAPFSVTAAVAVAAGSVHSCRMAIMGLLPSSKARKRGESLSACPACVAAASASLMRATRTGSGCSSNVLLFPSSSSGVMFRALTMAARTPLDVLCVVGGWVNPAVVLRASIVRLSTLVRDAKETGTRTTRRRCRPRRLWLSTLVCVQRNEKGEQDCQHVRSAGSVNSSRERTDTVTHRTESVRRRSMVPSCRTLWNACVKSKMENVVSARQRACTLKLPPIGVIERTLM